MTHRPLYRILVSAALIFVLGRYASAQQIPSPEEFYGFKMGADGELAHWNKIVEYFNLLSDRSDRVRVENLGETELGNPFLLAIFSAPDNLENLDRYRQISKKLADPRGLSQSEIEDLIKNGKYVSAQSYSIHASEVGGTQGATELAYELVTSNDPTIKMILDFLRPDSGSIEVFGRQMDERAKDSIGYLPEEKGLYRKLPAIPESRTERS